MGLITLSQKIRLVEVGLHFLTNSSDMGTDSGIPLTS
jgi:hypothetical protein